MTVPTISKMVKVYADSALVERLKCGRPSDCTVRNTMTGVRRFIRWLNERRRVKGFAPFDSGIGTFDSVFESDGSPLVSIVKPQLIHRYLAYLLKSNVNPITAMSSVYQFRQLFAKWVLPYYEDRGWKIPPFPSFGKRLRSPRYNRPSPQMIEKVKAWYDRLCSAPSAFSFPARRRSVPARELWFAATMMLEFAMRNGDIMRLTKDNFITVVTSDRSCVDNAVKHFLNYTPNKTVHSSGRMVKWPIHPHIWSLLCSSDSTLSLPVLDDEVFDALNREMRMLGFTGTKGAYELRKICIDHVYQRFGAELAVSISGDDIRTIMHYYADPAQPNIGAVRIVDLL